MACLIEDNCANFNVRLDNMVPSHQTSTIDRERVATGKIIVMTNDPPPDGIRWLGLIEFAWLIFRAGLLIHEAHINEVEEMLNNRQCNAPSPSS